MLVSDFAQRKKAAASFLQLFTNISICNAIKQFQSHINIVIVDTSDVFAYCGFFIPFGASILLTKLYPEFVSAIEAVVIVKDNFYCCENTNDGFHFYKSCYGMIVKAKILKLHLLTALMFHFVKNTLIFSVI